MSCKSSFESMAYAQYILDMSMYYINKNNVSFILLVIFAYLVELMGYLVMCGNKSKYYMRSRG